MTVELADAWSLLLIFGSISFVIASIGAAIILSAVNKYLLDDIMKLMEKDEQE